MVHKLASAFVYEEEKSLIHKLDPRTKLFISICLTVICLLTTNLLILIFLLLLSGLICIIGKEERKFTNLVISIVPILVIIFVVNFLFTKEILNSLIISLRFLAMMGGFTLFFIFTAPEDFVLMMETMHIPTGISFCFSLALRFVPVMAKEAERVVDAQRSRGLNLETKDPLKKLNALIPVFIPLIILSIRRSIEVAEALELRGFDVKAERSSVREIRMKLHDYFVVSLSLLALGVYIVARMYTGYYI